MKKINYILSIVLAIFLLNTSCDNDGGESASRISATNGALPDFNLVADSSPLIDLLNVDTTVLQFTVALGVGNPTSTDVKAYYLRPTGEIYGPVTLDSNVTSFPQEYTITGNDIIGLFSELNSSADFGLGDILKIFTAHTFSDGSSFDILNSDAEPNYYAADFDQYTDFTAKLEYPVSCPTMLEGNYISVVTDSNLDIPSNFRSPQPVTLTQPSAGNYVVSDGTADIFGPDFPISLTFVDLCGNLTVNEPSVQYGGVVDFIDNGATLNQETGVITLNLEYTATSCCGLPGIKWTLELTPVN